MHSTNLNYCGIAGFGALLSLLLLALCFSRSSALVLILHDYLVTFRQEVNMFWTRKLNGAAILFYLNRYTFITVYAIYQLSTYAPISDEVRLFLFLPCSRLHAHGNHLRGATRGPPASVYVPHTKFWFPKAVQQRADSPSGSAPWRMRFGRVRLLFLTLDAN